MSKYYEFCSTLSNLLRTELFGENIMNSKRQLTSWKESNNKRSIA
jgi:hypothetical protein